jgi:hypothetical protein
MRPCAPVTDTKPYLTDVDSALSDIDSILPLAAYAVWSSPAYRYDVQHRNK